MTKKIETFNTEILAKYFKGESSEEENILLFDWINASKENEEHFLDLRILWESGKLSDISLNDLIKDEWSNLESRIDTHNFQKHIKYKNQFSIKKHLYNAMKVAAIFVVAFGISWYMLKQEGISTAEQEIAYYEFKTPKGSKSEIDLPDGSKVYLNAESYLRFPEKFSNDNREIYLEGEAYFDIKKNKENPLTVKTSDINIKVIGTAFNVKSYPDEGTIETTLERGKIILENKNSNTSETPARIELEPNQRVTFVKKQGDIHLDNIVSTEVIEPTTKQVIRKEKIILNNVIETEKYTSWKDGKLIFDNESFENLAVKLERWFNIKIVIHDEELKQIRFTGTFEKESIEQGLEIMQLTTPILYTMDKNEIHIRMKN